MAARNIVERFNEHVRERPDKVALRHRVDGAWRDITWGDYGSSVERLGRALLALGFERHDRLTILSSNRPEWFFADLACMSLGGTTAPSYVTNSPEQVAHVVGHSRSKVAVVEDRDQLDKVLKMRSELPELRHVAVMDLNDASGEDDGFVLPWRALLARAEEVEARRYADLVRGVRAEDVATFVYTSGTTGAPKAVMLTHANIWWTCAALQEHIRIEDPPNARALSYLPLSHIAERMVSHMVQVYFGSQTWFAGSIDKLRDDLVDCRPTYFFGVPRVWEKFHGAVQARLDATPEGLHARLERALLARALAVGRKVSEAEQAAVGRGETMDRARPPLLVRLEHQLLERVVLSKARARAGLDQCTRTFSAAAPLDPDVIRFFHAMGIKIAEGYGQSETNGPTTWNPPDAIRIGTVGTALRGLQLRLADDGEVLVKGGNVSPGYYDDDTATAELLDAEGWLHSGDIGEIDELGYLRITDRKKDLLITSGGKNVAPQEIENRIKHDIVSHVVVIGDGRPFLTALVTLDEESAVAWGEERGITGGVAEVARDERTLKEIADAVERVNAGLARVEQIKKFRVLERDFVQEEDEITPTLKIRRRHIGTLYEDVIEDMYRRDTPQAAAARRSGT